MTQITAYQRFWLVPATMLVLFACFAAAGPRATLLLMIGLGMGLVLEGLRFGFAGPWRQMLSERDARGLVAQFLSVGLCALLAFPLLASAPDELSGAVAPVGLAMIVAAFVFGAAMQVVMGCGSGVLVNAGSGNLMALVALPGFIAGSFWGSLHVSWWTSLASLPVLSLQDLFGAAALPLTLTGLAGLALLAVLRASPGKRLPAARLWWAAGLLALLAVLNLVIAGQPWGVVYGLGLWGAKVASSVGMDVAATTAWAAPANAERLQQSLLTDVTSLTNIGLLLGAFVVMQWRRLTRGSADAQVPALSMPGWLLILLTGVVMGYSARVAFGCNVGAFFSGIATGSLHGWVWFVAAFAGSILGIRLRQQLLHKFSAAAATATATSEAAPRSGGLTRPASAMCTMALVVLLMLVDTRVALPINPFAAPPPAALGSGQAPAGAHCTDL